MFMPDPDPVSDLEFKPIPDPGVKKAPDPGAKKVTGSATLSPITVGLKGNLKETGEELCGFLN